MSIAKQECFPLILLVEDNIIALKFVENIATQAGVNFVSVTNGEDAFELLKHKHFDLLLTDLGLPGISGFDLAQLVRDWETISNSSPMPIIGLTAKDVQDIDDSYLETGFNKILAKPIYLKEMKNLLDTYCPVEKKDQPKSTKKKLDNLYQYPLFSPDLGIKNMGDENLLRDLLRLMINRVIPEDIAQIQKAYEDSDWNKIEEIAHKMKSGALYCGTVRMQFACQHFSDLQKGIYESSLEELYQQLIEVLYETKAYLKIWLQQ